MLHEHHREARSYVALLAATPSRYRSVASVLPVEPVRPYVTKNATLDAFSSENENDETVDPIEPVCEWRPDPRTCPRCGSEETVRWTDDGIEPVCYDCKDW